MGCKAEASAHYDLLAGSYDELYGQEQLRKGLISIGLAEPTDDDLALDAGCGSGGLLEVLINKRHVFAVGLDLSMGMLKRAKEKVGARAGLIHADVENLPLRDECFTVAFVITVLHGLPSPLKGLAEAARVLKRGGRLVATWLKKASVEVDLVELSRRAGLRPIKLLDLEGVQDLVLLAAKQRAGPEPRAYLRRIRNVKRGVELRSEVVRALREGGRAAKELAEALKVSYSSVLRQLRNLEREEIVERVGRPPFKWRLTGRGQSSLDEYVT